MILICPECGRKAEDENPKVLRRFCVLCTINKFKENSIHLSITEAVTYGSKLIENPELIVRMKEETQ